MQRRRRHSQVVRQGTANPRFSGSNPDGASIKGPEQKLRAFSFCCTPLPCRANGARAVPAGLDAWGGGRKAGMPWETWLPSVTLNVCVYPAPAIPRTRGVEDAAPYGRVLDVSISIVVNSRAIAPNLHPPLGSPERGAVAARSGVTEGLVPASVRC